MDDGAVMRVGQEMGYPAQDVREARQIMRDANVPEDKIASVLRLLCTSCGARWRSVDVGTVGAPGHGTGREGRGVSHKGCSREQP
jgi:hypothetical protein